ncbi:MAG: DNA (cytosine-5-)-methyltransferase [Actinomycetota bacterium]|nr:DNA (cytosine-5-)-methyltransferase [Actinomycetota bacterium]
MDKLFTVSEAANQLSVSSDTIRRWEKKGLIRSRRSERNHRVFDLGEVRRLQAKLQGVGSEDSHKVLKDEYEGEPKYKAIGLFAGAGGTALGFENASIGHSLLNEFDRNAAATLRANRSGWNVVHDDVADIDFRPYEGEVDILEGGFPCQAFSYAGKKLGFGDTRGTLFYEFARAVEETSPRVVVGENVRGLVNHDGGRTLRTMVSTLEGLGYRAAYKVLRSQYLDVPQKRERLFMFALREDVKSPILFPKERDYIVSLREAIGDRPESEGQRYSENKKAILEQVPPGGYWRDLPEDTQRSYLKASYFLTGGKTGMARRLSWDEPSLTLTCSPSQKQTERCHPEETRPLNVREYARIQTFPDDWNFSGSVGAQYKQIGNAVPVNLGYHIGKAAIAMLEGNGSETEFEAAPVENETPQNPLFVF